MPCEPSVPIRDYTLWQAMQPNNPIEKQMSHMSSINNLLTQGKMSHLCNFVHNYKYRVLTSLCPW